jgi:TRAP-type C4-dicarboxylate transport system permease small subunit
LRALLDRLYSAAAALAALCLIGLLMMVLLSIVGRLAGFYVPGTDAYAGYLMAGAGFLALAHTLKRGEHIRVTVLVAHLSGRARHALMIWSLAVATVLAAVLAWFAVRLAVLSWQFHDISTGNDATPLWLPQSAMAAGAVLLAIAVADELWQQAVQGRELAESGREAT